MLLGLAVRVLLLLTDFIHKKFNLMLLGFAVRVLLLLLTDFIHKKCNFMLLGVLLLLLTNFYCWCVFVPVFMLLS